MTELLGVFKNLFKEFGLVDDLINMYLVFIGVRTGCLIGQDNINIFYSIPQHAGLEIHERIYPGFNKTGHDYPLVCLKNSWVSQDIAMFVEAYGELTDQQVGLYLGFNCFDQDWKNFRIDRYDVRYNLYISGNIYPFYAEACSIKPDQSMIIRIKFKAKQMTEALKLINKNYKVMWHIEKIPGFIVKKRSPRRSPSPRRNSDI